MSSAFKSNRGSKSETNSSFSAEKTDGSKVSHREMEIIWPEWSDADINAEKWGSAIKHDSGAKHKPGSPSKESKGKNPSKLDNSTGKSSEIEQFEDPYPVELAWSLHKGNPIYWQRPHAIFPDTKLVIRSDAASICPDLTTSNRRLLRSEFIRSFISSIHTLTYIGHEHPFEIEWQSLQYTANTRNLPWEPWHHIYSLGRAGGSAQHNPVCNTLGKYAVRLFWLGCWRKIIVDDKFPLNSASRLLVPTTTIENNAEVELWPLLLIKALMKIASLSWTDHKELVDFDIITCLTGWAVQKLNIKGLDLIEKWDICCNYTNHFTWDKKMLKDDTETKVQEADVKPPAKSKDSKKAKKEKAPKGVAADAPEEEPYDFHLVGTLSNLRDYADVLEDISPCWSHECLIDATRSLPLVREVSDITEEFAAWKEFRWLDWAIEQGLWEADFTLENKKFLKVVSSLRKIVDNNTVDLETSYREKCIKCSVEAYVKFFEEKEAAKLGKKPVSTPAQTKEKSSAKAPKTPKIEKFIDPSIWCYFNNFGQYIDSLSIYIKPSSFSSRYVLTNFKISGPPLSKKVSKKDDKKSKDAESDLYKYIFWDNSLQKCRNDTMYLFTDSIDFRLTVFTLAHIGKDFPEMKKGTNTSNDELPTECNKTVCLSGQCIEECVCQKQESVESSGSHFIDRRRTASIIVEDYDWTKRHTGDMSMFLKTYGTSSLFFNFIRGRHVKRIWMNAEPSFCLHIFSDDPNIKIGKVDEILERMATESELLTKKVCDICSAFGNLVRFFTTPDFPQALRMFYKSYLPDDVQLSKKNAARIHECFLNELKAILGDLYPDMLHYDISRAIRVLFLDPSFRIPYTVEYEPYVLQEPDASLLNDSCPCVDTIEISDKQRLMAAIKIQSVFKMYQVKRMKDIHNINNNNLPRIIESIRCIYMDLFSSKNKDIYCLRLLRGMIFNSDISDLIDKYEFYRDLKSVVELKLFAGDVSELKLIKFIPFLKRTFNCCEYELYMRPYIFATLPTYLVRVFDNDTGDEIDRYTYNALVHKYVKNKKGYTIFAYGLSAVSTHLRNHNWKLLIITNKLSLTSAIDIDLQQNSLIQLEGYYLPNLDNLVTKIKIRINQSCKGAFHLQSSSLTARLKMECVTHDGNILAEAYGMSNVMIPWVNLLSESDDIISQETVSPERINKQTKKNRNQKRASSKSLAIKEKKRFERESSISIHPSVIMKKKTINPMDHHASLDFKEFYIRIIVLENSWPLTIPEWNTVKSVRTQLNVEPELFPIKPLTSKVSSAGHKKISTKFSPRRQSKLKEVNIARPFWVFSSFADGLQKQMNVTVDTSQIEKIREIKKNIILDDSRRYFDGKEKRQEFLEKSYLKWTPPKSPSLESISDNSLLLHSEGVDEDLINKLNKPIDNRKDIPRSVSSKKSVCPTCQKEMDPNKYEYLRPPESLHKMLPPFEYNRHHEKINEYRWPVDKKRENEILEATYEEIKKFEEENVSKIEAIDTYVKETKKNYKILHKWYQGIREESQQMMLINDTRRDNYQEKLKENKPAKEKAGKAANKSKKN